MLTLVDTPCQPPISHLFAELSERLGHTYRTVYWRGNHMGFPFIPTDGTHHLYIVLKDGRTVPGKFSEGDVYLANLNTTVFEALAWYFPGQFKNKSAMILRRSALIVLHGEPAIADLYVPAPDLTAHERIADIEALEAEYPNIFRIGTP